LSFGSSHNQNTNTKLSKQQKKKVKGRTPEFFQSIVDAMDFIHDGRT
jgi:hypothetical protein